MNPIHNAHSELSSSPRENRLDHSMDRSMLDDSASAVSDSFATMSQAETELHDNRTIPVGDGTPVRGRPNLRFFSAALTSTTVRKTPDQSQSHLAQHIQTTTTSSLLQNRPRTSLTPVGTRTGLTPHDIQRDGDKQQIRRTRSMDSAVAAQTPTKSHPQHKTIPPLFASTKPKHNAGSTATTMMNTSKAPSSRTSATNGSVLQSPPLLARRPISLGVASNTDQDRSSRRSVSATLSTTAFADNEELPKVNTQQDDENQELLSQTNDEDESNRQEDVVWEEEATPAQTAFGKELLFAREFHKKPPPRGNDLDTSSEGVLSTASEMGTIINNAARMAELDAELEREQEELLLNGDSNDNTSTYDVECEGGEAQHVAAEIQDHDKNNELKFPAVSESKAQNTQPGTNDDEEMTRLRPRPVWSNDSAAGVLPGEEDSERSLIMPGTATRTSTPQAQGVTSSPSGLSPSRLSMAVRKTMMNAAASSKRTPPQPLYEDIQPEGNMEERDSERREIGSMESGSFRQTALDSEGNAESEAPKTPPRAIASRTSVVAIPQSFSWSEGEGIEVALSPTAHESDINSSHNGDMIDDSFRTDTALVNSCHESPSRDSTDDTPASFLLRSPGSSAFLAASNSQKKKNRKSLWRQHRERMQERENAGSLNPGDTQLREIPFSSSASSISVSSSIVAPLAVSGRMSFPKPQSINWSTQKAFRVPIVDENEVLQDPEVYGSNSDSDDRVSDSKRNGAQSGASQDQHLHSPRRIERECFSFDDDIRNSKQSSSPFGKASAPTASQRGGLIESETCNTNGISRASQAGSTHVLLGSENISFSWDVASSTNTPFKSPSAAARQRLRERPQQGESIHAISNYASVFTANQPSFLGRRASGPPTIPEYTGLSLPLQQDSELHPQSHQQPPPPHDFSPLIPNHNMAEELKTPQRIEIEREDAIDILACLVERGVSLHQNPPSTSGSQTTVSTRNTAFSPDEKQPRLHLPPPNNQDDLSSTLSMQDMTTVVEQLKEMARSEEDTSKRRMHISAIDELIKSHIYALEMSQAAKSACSWLKSIGRENAVESTSNAADHDEEDESEKKEDDFKQSFGGKRDATETPRNSLELLTYKARLHAAEDQLAAKEIELQRLNEELAQCRAEIGRIRSAGHVAPFRSPNRSILDESEDVSLSEGEDDHGTDGVTVGGDEEAFRGTTLVDDSEGQVIVYKKALQEANATIEKLHCVLNKSEDGVPGFDIPDNPPYVFVEEGSIDKNPSPGNKEEATVNVHMLDGENFITDWDDAPPLPPPPDHNLRSPIVQSVLESWSTDEDLHESMLAWMEQILTGVDPENVPPLTISNLDHQLKDGFSLHVLPLLLRRKDILVEMKTRVQRRTTYDLSISVDRPSVTGLDMRRHLETIAARSDVGAADSISVTHSATTTLMGNGRGTFGMNSTVGTEGPDVSSGNKSPGEHVENGILNQQHLMYDEMAEELEDPNGAHSTGLISALGGALGGFLTRHRTKAVPVSPGEFHDPTVVAVENQNNHDPSSMSPSNKPASAAAAAELDEEQPYHRVVSAPSGRIGVTFVEFRGHAMVSDVAPDSPLQGWIFPSDILIAIDELPVSGMRVRDIIQVLKDRMDRQRALRIISCHAMNDITDFSGGSTSPFFGEAET